jgi:ABC-type branched-subunit amino acid transport system permease subunit
MNENIKTGILYGIAGGLLTFLFAGWSVTVIGIVLGVGLGAIVGDRFKRKEPIKLALEMLPTALVAATILVILSLVQNYKIYPSIGKAPYDINTVMGGNLTGFLGVIVFACLMAAFRGLPPQQERIAKLIVLGFLIVAFPFFDQFSQLRWTAQIIFALIFVILGLGLNIVVGYAGLLDLGYAAFFAIGAYTTGILSSPQHNIFLNFWLVIWIAAAVGAIFGLILGAPTLPLRGDYLAIVTLGFGEIVPVLFRNLIDVTIKEPLTCWILPLFRLQTKCITFMANEDLTAGEKGINPIGRPILPFISHAEALGPGLIIKWVLLILAVALTVYFFLRARANGNRSTGRIISFVAMLAIIVLIFLPVPHPKSGPFATFVNIFQPGEFRSDNPVPWYFLIIGIILLSVFLINRLRESRLGRAWMAIREDELAAAQMGINPVRTKLLAFAMGATFSGFAGAFYAAYISGIFPGVFDFSASIIILSCVILGGLGNINGVIVGGLVLMTADRLFLPALKDFLAGLLQHTLLPALSSNPTLQTAVAQNANPILYRFLLFGLTLVIMMAVRPEGLIPSQQIREELHADENEPAPAGATAPAMESGTPK